MLTIQEQAEVLRLGVTIGTFEPKDAVAWADRVITEEAKPDNAVIEVAMAAGVNQAQMATLLKEAASAQAPGKPRDVLFGILAQELAKDASLAGAIAGQLKALKSAYDAPDALLNKAADLAGPFGHGDDAAASRAVSDFLAPYAALAASFKL